MHARLAEVDPETAARLHPNDAQRIRRALEIYRLSGVPASHQFRQPRAGGGSCVGPVLRIAVCPAQREDLRQRIAERFKAMIAQGFVAEVARLRGRGDLHPELPAMRAVGYRQLWRHLDGACDLEQAVTLGVNATRQYAKRQLTWLRSEPDWHWLDPMEPNGAGAVLNLLERARS
jgi:tRNA dimethylallyltransferase